MKGITLTMQDKETLIRKINKLLALAANNPNSAEAASAQAKAFKMMTENDISLNDVIMPGTEAANKASYNSDADYSAANQSTQQATAQETDYAADQNNQTYYQEQYQQQTAETTAAPSGARTNVFRNLLLSIFGVGIAWMIAKALFAAGHYFIGTIVGFGIFCFLWPLISTVIGYGILIGFIYLISQVISAAAK